MTAGALSVDSHHDEQDVQPHSAKENSFMMALRLRITDCAQMENILRKIRGQ
jgi:hypothetical protein